MKLNEVDYAVEIMQMNTPNPVRYSMVSPEIIR